MPVTSLASRTSPVPWSTSPTPLTMSTVQKLDWTNTAAVVRDLGRVVAGEGGHRGDHSVLVWNKEDAAVAAAHSVDPDRWWTGFSELLDRIGGRFTRHEPRRHAAALMLGIAGGSGPEELLVHRRAPGREVTRCVAAPAVPLGVGRRPGP